MLAYGPSQRERVGLNSRAQYLPLLWPVRQLGAAVKHNDVIVTLGLLSKQHVGHTPISHVSLLVHNLQLPSLNTDLAPCCYKINHNISPWLGLNYYA